MKHENISIRRRQVVLAGAVGMAAPAIVAAQQCAGTPRDALGPFYKDNAPAATNVCASGSGGKEKLLVSGRILGADCKPLAGALVEVWQADAKGDYSGVTRGKADDPGCLLRASLTTDGDGRYFFNTIVPGEYPGRPRHIHYRVSHKGHATLVTQLYFDKGVGALAPLVVSTTKDETGMTRAAFEVTLARAA
ncbi:MAG: hypothetical protein ABL891_04110 [Burkholderiales bacterium]